MKTTFAIQRSKSDQKFTVESLHGILDVYLCQLRFSIINMMADNNDDDSFEVVAENMELPPIKAKASIVDTIIAKG